MADGSVITGLRGLTARGGLTCLPAPHEGAGYTRSFSIESFPSSPFITGH
jgi:hypothetical protein